MNEDLEKLYAIGKKASKLIIGLMSGTSLDGLDVALCEITGYGCKTEIALRKFLTLPYNTDYKDEVKKVFSKKDGSLERLALLNGWIGKTHAAMVNDCLHKWNIKNKDVDLIASHGQTVYHAPTHFHKNIKFDNATLQIGDGDHIAVRTGVITISDFRQKNIAAGGEGAPLAAYGDFILFAEKENDVILLNIGGIANFTYLPANAAFDKIICSDIGPGNTLMDAWMQKSFPGKFFDEDAGIATQGRINEVLLKELKKNIFFNLPFPKTTGPELFNLSMLDTAMKKTNTKSLPVEDVMATLNHFTAEVIRDAFSKLKIINGCKVFMSGGGVHNPLLIANIKKMIPGFSFHNTGEHNINPDAKEAILFAILANEAVAGNGSDFGNNNVGFPGVGMGKISFPR